MKTATITLSVTPDTPMPPSQTPFAAQAGFRLTLTRVATEGTVSTPVENKLTWVIGNFVEGEEYSLVVAAVDVNGQVIQSLPATVVRVPATQTFTRVDSLAIAWS